MNPTPKISTKYGAPLGRVSKHAEHDGDKFTLRKIRLDRSGYDQGGAYWGLGSSLYWCGNDSGSVDYFFRIDKTSREAEAKRLGLAPWEVTERNVAKAMVRADYPQARFYS